MILLIIFLLCLLIACGTGVLAAWSDFKGLTIPNLYTVMVGGSFFAGYALLWLFGRDDIFGPFLGHLVAGLIVFAITAVMFSMRALGAADSKLGTAYALWVGLEGLIPFLFYMTLVGGVLGLVGLCVRKWKPFKSVPEGVWLDRLQKGDDKVPYGIAIVLGALASFVKIGYFSGEALASFVLY